MYFSAFVSSSVAVPAVLVAFGLATGFLLWALLALRTHHNAGRRVSFTTVSLLVTDIAEMIFLAVIAIVYMAVSRDNPTLSYAYGFFVVCMAVIYFRLCASCFHQLAALEGLLSLTSSLGTTGLATPRVSIPISVAVWVWGIVSVYLTFQRDLSVLLLATYLACLLLLVVSSIVTCLKANAQSPPVRKQVLRVFGVATATHVLLYGPVFTCVCLYAMGLPQGEVFNIAAAIMNFSLVTDPLLLALVLRRETQRSPVNERRLDMSVVGA
ncbi:uncharacterized protein LOC134437424 [Engraulis encrasicolus]|uniref:uncharacterized protein LOC134437424 n=1 Tax=Engraulis encrasicolus TaxID=184585 RepID=UPI002FD22517